ncbi:hypothetical protein DICPUDRAFT_151225 [Dictyostelium purpureum]|uniref:Uncharacterized protein n=1 Tax=Dictyostelium purpureum TaxID=5786 RepID=F0ZIB2_DICPU|nr:uncharacterized protein DICPUDRAFT_151225 [Dictyostelium purpureum]EGC36327.1 hypothetical protein DICPUDRAFT_151225 [Dictyostelium purpureum]|eukprot:XP_003287142.1 hypothetical protein DICPUDRAFT_151225 [Dictyostelium purpureum]
MSLYNEIILPNIQKNNFFLASVVLNAFETKATTSSKENSLQIIKRISTQSDQIKSFLKNIGKSYLVFGCGALINIAHLFGANTFIKDNDTRYKFLVTIYEIDFPIFNYFSSLLFVEQESPKVSLFEIVKNKPKQTITNLVYFVGINMIQNRFVDFVNNYLTEYFVDNYQDHEMSDSKRLLLKAIYLVLSNQIASIAFNSAIFSPFINISNQYCRKLINSSTNEKDEKDSFDFVKSNPIYVINDLFKTKGFFSGFYSGVLFTVLSSSLKSFWNETQQ